MEVLNVDKNVFQLNFTLQDGLEAVRILLLEVYMQYQTRCSIWSWLGEYIFDSTTARSFECSEKTTEVLERDYWFWFAVSYKLE